MADILPGRQNNQTYQIFSFWVKLYTLYKSLVSFDRYDDRDIADIEHSDGFLAKDIMLTYELVNAGVYERDNVLACHGNLAATWTIANGPNS